MLCLTFINKMALQSLRFINTSFTAVGKVELFKARPFLNNFRCKHLSTMEAKDSKEDHLMRTSSNTRDAGVHSMTVKAVSKLSPTIKEVVLPTEGPSVPFKFKAGQWVDLFIPGVETVGGFSMCSSPQELTSKGQLRLAIKHSSHPPALWMHEKCKVGEKVNVRVGGDFFMTAGQPETATKLALLIAGGVGINPLASMVHYAMEKESGIRMCLLYSSKSTDELIFKEFFDNYSNSKRDFTVKYFVTSQDALQPESNMNCRRICASDLRDATDWLKSEASTKEAVEAFICGPPPMIQEISEFLGSLNIKKVHYEKWW